MILVACPHCEKRIVGSNTFAGQYPECPNCGDLFVALPVNDDGYADDSKAVSGDGEIRLPPAWEQPEVMKPAESRIEAQSSLQENGEAVVEEESQWNLWPKSKRRASPLQFQKFV